MAQGRITSVSQMTGNMSKLEKQVRKQVEAEMVAAPASKPKPEAFISKAERKIFNKFVKLNDSFNEADSTSLSLLTRAIYRYTLINEAMDTIDVFDEKNSTLERRALAYDKAISQHMTALSIPLTQRLRMANDIAKVMIEEKKLQKLEEANKPQFINPLQSLLDDDDDDDDE